METMWGDHYASAHFMNAIPEPWQDKWLFQVLTGRKQKALGLPQYLFVSNYSMLSPPEDIWQQQ